MLERKYKKIEKGQWAPKIPYTFLNRVVNVFKEIFFSSSTGASYMFIGEKSNP